MTPITPDLITAPDGSMSTPDGDVDALLARYHEELDDSYDDLGPTFDAHRINVDQSNGNFIDGKGNSAPAFQGVIVGFLSQRIHYAEQGQPTNAPVCRSNEGRVGHPQDYFPLVRSKLNIVMPALKSPSETYPTAKCVDCNEKEWVNSKKPFCTEQITLVLWTKFGSIDGSGQLMSFSVQGGSFKPAKVFLKGIRQRKLLPMSFVTHFSTHEQKTVGNDWHQIIMKEGEASDVANYQTYHDGWIKGSAALKNGDAIGAIYTTAAAIEAAPLPGGIPVSGENMETF